MDYNYFTLILFMHLNQKGFPKDFYKIPLNTSYTTIAILHNLLFLHVDINSFKEFEKDSPPSHILYILNNIHLHVLSSYFNSSIFSMSFST